MVDPSATEEAPPAANGAPTPRDVAARPKVVQKVVPPSAGAPPAEPARRAPVQQMTAGHLAELLQDVEASTPVWQLGDEDELLPVYFVEINRINGLVEKLVLR